MSHNTSTVKMKVCEGLSYFPVSMLERDGQHMGVVTKALEKEVPPSSMMRRVLFIACIEPTERERERESAHHQVATDVTDVTDVTGNIQDWTSTSAALSSSGLQHFRNIQGGSFQPELTERNAAQAAFNASYRQKL